MKAAVLRWWSYGILVAIALGIILPSGFLSYLGLRSFRYERLLLQKQTEERYTALGDALQGRASEVLEGLLSSLNGLVESQGFIEWNPETIAGQLLKTNQLGRIPLSELWMMDREERLFAPVRQASSIPAQPVILDWGHYSPTIERLERLEISENRVADAVEEYKSISRKDLPPVLMAALLKMIAADERKLGNLAAAEQYYSELRREYDQVLDPTGFPTGLVASDLLAKFYAASHQETKAVPVLLDLDQSLLLNHWPLAAKDRQLWILQIDRRLKDLRSSPAWTAAFEARWTRLHDLQDRLAATAPRAEAFSERTWPMALRHLRERGTLDKGDVLTLDASQALVVLPIKSAQTGERRGSLVAILSASDLWSLVDGALDELAKPLGLRAEVQFKTGGSLRAPLHTDGETAVLHRSITAGWPPAELILWAPNSTAADTFARRRMRIYTLMTAISLLVLLAGLGVMTLAIRKEVEMAHLKSEFVSNLSHQIRTPLYAITHIAERLQLGRYRSNEELHSFYGMLLEEVKRLRGLVDDAMDFSKLVNGPAIYHKIREDLRHIATEAETAIRQQAADEEFKITMNFPETPLWVQADRKALVQAVINLLDNAMKYSPGSHQIALTVRARAARALLSVSDKGIGIESSHKTKIFDKFYRVEEAMARTTAGGVGLGLAIVKHIVEGHEGSIHVSSEPGQGSTFTIELPIAVEAGEQIARNLKHGNDIKNP